MLSIGRVQSHAALKAGVRLLEEHMSTTITLDDDVALVLFELLTSERLESGLEPPERNALWALEAYLEKTLVQPFAPNYRQLLEKARAALAERGGS
jgi:hypothetical protein